jgi:uncharacterized membrane protein
MTILAVITLTASVVSAWAGSVSPATGAGCALVLLGVLLFCLGGFFIIVAAAGQDPVYTDVEPWGDDND